MADRNKHNLLASVLAVALFAAPVGGHAAESQPVPVDLELAFVVDASGSIDEEETRLQRQGYAGALINPRIQAAISRGILRAIAVSYIEFAADGCERLGVPWMRIANAAEARDFGNRVLAQPLMFCSGGNAIGDAIALAAMSIDRNGFEGTRRVIDVSGDGPNTTGELAVEFARDMAVAKAITVNGLVIERPSMPELDLYYREAVTGGPGSFVIKAKDRQSFAKAILKKLILEIAAPAAPPRRAAMARGAQP
ncbi:MAG: DUF1194 domain-containing protein [Alphaproteobacteria bacterium]